MLGIGGWKQRMVDPSRALPGRETPMPVRNAHHVHGRPIAGEFTGLQSVQFGMGCFWGAERFFWKMPGCIPGNLIKKCIFHSYNCHTYTSSLITNYSSFLGASNLPAVSSHTSCS